MTGKLRMLDLFSGIGGFSYAAEHLVGGFTTTCFVEREPFCQRVLAHHWPGVSIHDDITTFNPKPHSADVVCGGFPCQDISTAGKQAGIKQGTRSGLFYELIRVVCLVQPRFIVLENVAAILTNGLDTVLGELAEAGYDAEWACIPASAVGACHQRDRWWCVAYPQGERWRAGAGQGQVTARPEGTGAGDGSAGFIADAPQLLSHGGPGQQQGQSGRRSVSESGDGDGAAAHSMRQRLQGPHKLAGRWPQWPAAPLRLSPDWGGMYLNPCFVEEMMGFPVGWTALRP